jgi:SPP1 family phage portal protein
MELEQLQSLLANYEDAQKAIAAEVTSPKVNDFLKEYRVATHTIFDKALRPDKLVTTDNGSTNVKVARLGVPMQKRIVQMAVTFLCGRSIKLNSVPADQSQTDLLAAITRTWEDNKLDYDTQELARILFSETEVAEIWYAEDAEEGYWGQGAMQAAKVRLRMKIVANSLGDKLYPVFNAAGDMIAFGRGFTKTVQGKKIDCYDLYTEAETIIGEKGDAGWVTAPTKNMLNKIPVIYYRRTDTEWADVQSLIDRFEMMISRSADTNDYFGAPMVKVKGEIKGFASKGEDGKVLELKDDAEASYLTWDQSPANVENEFKRLRSLILDLTDTPDISFENMKGIGTFSGIALKMMFLGAHMKASSNEQIFGKGIQRRLNLIKAAMGKINTSFEAIVPLLNVKPVFEYFIPEDVEGKVNTLINAVGVGKGIMSQETAVRMNPLVTDADAEISRLEEERNQELPGNLL